MPRAPDERIKKAFELYKTGMKLIEIASQLNLPPGTVRRWKSTHDWDSERSEKKSERSNKKKGGQPGNKNSVGHVTSVPLKNKNAEKHGFFSRYLPEETFSIVQEIEKKDPLDILWENIQLSYAAIVRAQQISYVKDNKDDTIIKSGYKDGNVIGEDYLVQTAIDKQSKFMQAQARAQGTLMNLIKQYDEMLHKNWELATEEQKARIEILKAKTNTDSAEEIEDDGFIEALKGKVDEIWQEE